MLSEQCGYTAALTLQPLLMSRFLTIVRLHYRIDPSTLPTLKASRESLFLNCSRNFTQYHSGPMIYSVLFADG